MIHLSSFFKMIRKLQPARTYPAWFHVINIEGYRRGLKTYHRMF
jgi:hypothetical protein